MWRSRDPTKGDDDFRATRRAEAMVIAHLDALRNAGDCGTVFADDVTLTLMETGEITRGRAAAVSLLDYLHQHAFSAPPSVSSLVSSSGRAIVEAELAGVHAGNFAGIASTGRQVRVAYVAAYDLGEGAISAVRLYLPFDSLVRQVRDA